MGKASFRSIRNSPRAAAIVALLAFATLAVNLAELMVTNLWDLLATVAILSILLLATWRVLMARQLKRWVNATIALLALMLLLNRLLFTDRDLTFDLLSVLLFGAIGAIAAGSALKPNRDLPSVMAIPLRPPKQRSMLLVNPRSGEGKAQAFGIVETARRWGIAVHVLQPGEDVQELAQAAIGDGAEAIGMAGGDGSLGLVAQVAMRHDIPFVCIPAGTRNNFARDLGLDYDDPRSALLAFSGKERRVDVGSIGERVFLNNASFGIYPEIVREPGYRRARLLTAHTVITRVLNGEREPFDLRFSDPDGHAFHSAFMLLVANNPYDTLGLDTVGWRSKLTRGVLQVSMVRALDVEAVERLAGGMLLGHPGARDGWLQWHCQTLSLDAASGRLEVGVDGEHLQFPAPVELRSHPRALRVLVPPGTTVRRRLRLPHLHPEALGRLWAMAMGREG
jgi:diacylglycerol kinase family enzyme